MISGETKMAKEKFTDFPSILFHSRKLLQENSFAPEEVKQVCTSEKYKKCFNKCPPAIPKQPPPPPSLEGYKEPWCKAHVGSWNCSNTPAGPEIASDRVLTSTKEPARKEPGDDTAMISTIAVGGVVLISLLVVLIVFLLKKRRKQAQKKALSNTYNVGYQNTQSSHPWANGETSDVHADEGSEIFYQVTRNAVPGNQALANSGGPRNVPDVVHSSNATISRSASSSSKTPLIPSPGSHYNTAGRTRLTRFNSAGGPTPEADVDGHSTIGSMAQFGNYGVAFSGGRRASNEGTRPRNGAASIPANGGYSTYSPAAHKGSHPSLYKKNSAENSRTPRSGRNRSFGTADNRPRPLRKQSNASSGINRSDSVTSKNPQRPVQTYRDNWDNFDEVVTATMQRRGRNKELVLNTDSFVESSDFVVGPDEPKEATTVDQLGLPTRNPFLAMFEDTHDDNGDFEHAFEDISNNSDYMDQSGLESPMHYYGSPEYNNSPSEYSGRSRNRSAPQTVTPSQMRRGSRPRHISDNQSPRHDIVLPSNHQQQRGMAVAREYVDLGEDSDASVEV